MITEEELREWRPAPDQDGEHITSNNLIRLLGEVDRLLKLVKSAEKKRKDHLRLLGDASDSRIGDLLKRIAELTQQRDSFEGSCFEMAGKLTLAEARVAEQQ